MRVGRTFALVAVACLVTPSVAGAKGGVIFDMYPDVQAVGSPMKFTLMLFDREGVRPLVTFRNPGTREVVRVRASRSDLNGIAYGTVRLPSRGPWDTEVSIGGRVFMEDDSEPFRVGVGLTETIPSADAERARADAAASGGDPAARVDPPGDAHHGALPWAVLASAAALVSALAVVLIRRRRRWGAA